jgi:hypothetical protein
LPAIWSRATYDLVHHSDGAARRLLVARHIRDLAEMRFADHVLRISGILAGRI